MGDTEVASERLAVRAHAHAAHKFDSRALDPHDEEIPAVGRDVDVVDRGHGTLDRKRAGRELDRRRGDTGAVDPRRVDMLVDGPHDERAHAVAGDSRAVAAALADLRDSAGARPAATSAAARQAAEPYTYAAQVAGFRRVWANLA